MNLPTIKDKKYLILLPALTALLITLIPTLKYQWPLGWDIIYHAHYAQHYVQYGLTLTDPLLNWPYGQKIGYPPLFHFLLAFIGTICQVDFLQVAKFLQPVLATSIILSVSYVAYRFYGEIAGAGAGFLMLSSYLLSRMVIPLPENLALIFIPLSVYLYFNSIKNKNMKTALFGGMFFILVLLTHNAATLCLALVIASITILELGVYRDYGVLKSFFSYLLPLIILVILGLIAVQIWSPQTLQTLLQEGLTAATGINIFLPTNRPLGILSYLGNLGILLLPFSIIGCILALKKRNHEDIVVFVWILCMVFLSNAYIFGINVISYRVLIYLLIPLSIIGGYGINYLYQKIEFSKKISSKNAKIAFLAIIFGLCIASSITTVVNPKISDFHVKNQFETIQIAPPSNSEVELVEWFQQNGNKSRSFVIANQFTGMFIVYKAGMGMDYGFPFYALKNNPDNNISTLKEKYLGYIVYDKRLVLPSEDNKLYIKTIPSEFFSLFYFSQNITNNFDNIKPDYATKVYENKDFIVCKIDY